MALIQTVRNVLGRAIMFIQLMELPILKYVKTAVLMIKDGGS